MPTSTFFNLPDKKREKLLECAIDEFADHDYQSASVSRIVSQAGISKGSLYQYFKDKEDLYHYLLTLAAQKKADLFSSFSLQESDKAWHEVLFNLFQVMAAYELKYPKFSRIGFRATNGNSPLPEEIINKAKQSTSQYFFDLIEEGKQRGQVRADVDTDLAVFIFYNTLSGLGDYLKTKTSLDFTKIDLNENSIVNELGIESVFNQIVSILQNGMSKK